MTKKTVPTPKSKKEAISEFVESGIDELQEVTKVDEKSKKEVKQGRKPKKDSDKYKRYNFTFPPEFIEQIDEYLKQNQFEGSSRSGFIHRIVSLYLQNK